MITLPEAFARHSLALDLLLRVGAVAIVIILILGVLPAIAQGAA